MARTAFGRPLRSAAFDAVISLGIAVFALAAIRTRPAGWCLTLIGLAMAVAVLFRRTRPCSAGIAVAALAASVLPARRAVRRPVVEALGVE